MQTRGAPGCTACAGGRTPWGTWLTCMENINGYFSGKLPEAHREARNYTRMGFLGAGTTGATNFDRNPAPAADPRETLIPAGCRSRGTLLTSSKDTYALAADGKFTRLQSRTELTYSSAALCLQQRTWPSLGQRRTGREARAVLAMGSCMDDRSTGSQALCAVSGGCTTIDLWCVAHADMDCYTACHQAVCKISGGLPIGDKVGQ